MLLQWFPSMTAALKAETEEARAEAMKQTLAGLELLEEALARGEASSAVTP